MIVGMYGGNIVGGHAPFYVKHKALANLNNHVHFPVEIHLQLLFTTVIITGAVAPIAPVLPLPLHMMKICTLILLPIYL